MQRTREITYGQILFLDWYLRRYPTSVIQPIVSTVLESGQTMNDTQREDLNGIRKRTVKNYIAQRKR